MKIFAPLTRLLSKLSRSTQTNLKAYRARRALVPLLYLDERMLRDIGLSRSDVVDCLSSPFAGDPASFLDERRKSRRLPAASDTRLAA